MSATFSRRHFVLHLPGAVAATRACLGAAGPWQIGCYTRPWDQHDYRVALDGIAEAGYRYAGLMTHKGKSWIMITPDTTPEEAAAMGAEVRKRGLQTISIYGGDFAVEQSVAAGVTGLKRLIDNTAACQCPGLLLGGTGKVDLVAAYFKVVAECCDYASEKGVHLTIKPHGGTNATGAECRRLVEKVGNKNLRIWYDPGNILYYSQGKIDPVSDVASVDGFVSGMSIKDFRPPKEVMVTPGTGQVDFRKVLARA
ncbi:MAG TPA: TIM barrel protein, partial [Bryobacteraceae bacterium]|nr:TIM barrel protein [Bryobacteraceae bacterium]